MDRHTEHTVPSQHSEEGTNSSLAYGDTGPLKERDTSESDKMNYSNSELDGEQMRAPGEGDVANAVQNKDRRPAGHGEEGELAGDMERKAEEHTKALHERGEKTGKEIEEEQEDWTGKSEETDVAEALGGRGTGIVLAAEE